MYSSTQTNPIEYTNVGAKMLKTPRTNCNHSSQAIRYAGAIKYNAIPEDIKPDETYTNFKKIHALHEEL